MSENHLKYRIKACLILLFGPESEVAKAKYQLFKQFQIPPDTLKHDLNIRMGEKAVIPDDRLDKYAKFLSVEKDYLKADLLAFQNRHKVQGPVYA